MAGAALSLSCLACGDGSSRWILRRSAVEPADGSPQGADASTVSDAASDAGDDASIEPLPDADAFTQACSPEVSVDNLTADGNGALFDRAFPEPEEALVEIAKQVCALLYKEPHEVPASPPIVLVIDDFFGIGEIGITAPVIYIRLSSLHMQSAAAEGKDVRAEIAGDLHYLLAIDYELDDEDPSSVRWVLEGIAAWTRYRAGYTPIDERLPGGNPIDDPKTAGFFFDWLDRTYPDAIYRLNQSLDPTDGVRWSEHIFETISGRDLNALWSAYQDTL
jgi:hypothetical protein